MTGERLARTRLAVVEAREVASDRIAGYVLGHAAASVFHGREWAALAADAVGARVRSLVALKEGEVAGLLPLALVWSPIRGRRLLSFPFSRFVPVLAEGGEAATALVERAIRLARELRASTLEIRCGESVSTATLDAASARAGAGRAWRIVPGFDNYALNLTKGLDAIRSGLHPRSARRSIRLAGRRGVEIEWVDPGGAVRTLRQLELATRRRQGSAAYPRGFLPSLVRRFGEPPGQLWVGLARRAGEVVAAEVALVHGRCAHGIMGLDSGERAREARCGHALLWATIERASQAGLARFDLGPAHAGNEGLVSFKRRFGAEVEPAHAAILPLGGRGFPSDDLDAPAVRAARALLRRLPPAALALASEWLGRETL